MIKGQARGNERQREELWGWVAQLQRQDGYLKMLARDQIRV